MAQSPDSYEDRHHVFREKFFSRYELGMNSNSKRLVDPRTHINMSRLLSQLQERRLTPYSRQPALVKMKPLEKQHVPPVLLPILTKSQLIILDDIEETLAGF